MSNVTILSMSDEPKRRYSLFPKMLESCIEPLTRPLFKAHGSAAARLIMQWNAIAGEELARHTRVEKLSFPQGKKNGGTLTVAVENGFATALQHLQPVILDRLAEYFGYRAIARIAISHAFQPSAVSTIRATKVNPSLSLHCAGLADGVADHDLKEALQSLAKTLSASHL